MVACGILDALVREADKHQLDEWEPELAAQVYAALIGARRAAGSNLAPVTVPDDELMSRLCRLAPAQALRAAGR